ncbi:MAG TPA: hypothetical protein V6D14_06240 [Coleofasciculaceae cyanobacterium]|jgi:hypothetical protein
MLKRVPSRQRALNWFRLTSTLTPLSLGVAFLATAQMSVEARPVFIQSPPPTTQIIGSPIPSPVPVVPGTTTPYSLSNPSYNSVITPGRSVIRNSTLINPTIINSRVSDSVLIDPVIINSQRSPLGTYRRGPFIYNQPSVRIRIGQ